jgi:hypothetical protein
MEFDDTAALRSELRKVIGMDRVHITAHDEVRHFDPITLVTVYAGSMFLAFITSAVKKIGEKAGEAFWDKAVILLAGTEHSPVDADGQLAQMKAADEAARLIAPALSEQYLKEFLEAGKETVELRLIHDNFPAVKAKRIAEGYTAIIAKRLK